MYLMTPDEIAIYHIGDKVKLEMKDGQVVDDYLDDIYMNADCVWSYTMKLRGRGNINIGADVLFDWSPE